MDFATIAVLVMTAVAVGALVWLHYHSRGTGGAPDEPQERPTGERQEPVAPDQAPQPQKRKKRK